MEVFIEEVLVFVIGVSRLLLLGFDEFVVIMFLDDEFFLMVNMCLNIIRFFVCYLEYEEFKWKMDFVIKNFLCFGYVWIVYFWYIICINW